MGRVTTATVARRKPTFAGARVAIGIAAAATAVLTAIVLVITLVAVPLITSRNVRGTYRLSFISSFIPTLQMTIDSHLGFTVSVPGRISGSITGDLTRDSSRNGDTTYLISDLDFTGDLGDIILSQTTGGMSSAETNRELLRLITCRLTLPDGLSKGSPQGTWAFSASVPGRSVSARAVFSPNGVLTLSTEYPGLDVPGLDADTTTMSWSKASGAVIIFHDGSRMAALSMPR